MTTVPVDRSAARLRALTWAAKFLPVQISRRRIFATSHSSDMTEK